MPKQHILWNITINCYSYISYQLIYKIQCFCGAISRKNRISFFQDSLLNWWFFPLVQKAIEKMIFFPRWYFLFFHVAWQEAIINDLLKWITAVQRKISRLKERTSIFRYLLNKYPKRLFFMSITTSFFQ